MLASFDAFPRDYSTGNTENSGSGGGGGGGGGSVSSGSVSSSWHEIEKQR